MEITNITNPGKDPVEGDWVQIVQGNTVIKQEYHAPYVQTEEDIKAEARGWRDAELKNTDWVFPLTDHPQHAAYKAYRQELRDWPSTADFPATKPTLGS